MTIKSSILRSPIVIAWLVLMPIVLWPKPLVANADAQPEKQVGQERLLTGSCETKVDPAAADFAAHLPILCVRAEMVSEAVAGLSNSHENHWLIGGKGSAVFAWSTLLGGELSGSFLRAEASGERHRGNELAESKELEVATLNVGNPALHRLRLALGRPALPFGLGEPVFMEVFNIIETSGYRRFFDRGGVVTWDNNADTVVDIGIFSDKSIAADSELGRISNDAGVARVMFDIPALDGSRMMASFYGDKLNERRIGFVFMNYSVKGDLTYFEFDRRYTKEVGSGDDQNQLLRLAYQAAMPGKSRWTFQYDDERRQYRLGVIGWDHQLTSWASQQIHGRLSLAYRKGEREDLESQWFVAGGLRWLL